MINQFLSFSWWDPTFRNFSIFSNFEISTIKKESMFINTYLFLIFYQFSNFLEFFWKIEKKNFFSFFSIQDPKFPEISNSAIFSRILWNSRFSCSKVTPENRKDSKHHIPPFHHLFFAFQKSHLSWITVGGRGFLFQNSLVFSVSWRNLVDRLPGAFSVSWRISSALAPFQCLGAFPVL